MHTCLEGQRSSKCEDEERSQPHGMRQRTNKIGIVMPLGHQQGGAEALLMHLLRDGCSRYQFLCVFLQDGPLVEQARGLGYRTFVVPVTRLSDPRNYLKTVFWFRKWLRHERPEAVLSWMPKAHLYVAPAAIMSKVKTLWFQHGISHKGKMDRITTFLPANRVLCCSFASKAAQDDLRPKRPSSVCYPGVMFPTSNPIPTAQAREQLGLDPKASIIGMVARLERWKGAHIFIEAAKIVSATDPGAYFFVVGGPHPRDLAYAKEVQAAAAQAGLGDRLILADQRPASEVPLWQSSADVIVHPVTGEEPFGMAVVEAMGMGRVVVASDAGGPSEIIQDGVNSFLVPRGDAPKLAAKLIQLLRSPVELQRIAANAFVRGRSFSVMQFAQRIEELLTETLHC